MDYQAEHLKAIGYIRAKVNQLLMLLGTLPLRPEELDDDTLIDLDPIGIVAGSFQQVLSNLQATNHELNLARSEIRAIFDSMGAAIMVLNNDGLLEDCNRQALQWFFGEAELVDVIGKPLSATCHCFGSCGEEMSEPPPSNEFFCDGYHFLRINSEVRDEQGAREKRILLLFDLTRQKETEADLRLYATVFDHTAEGIAITDRERRFIRVNDAFCAITGYSPEELIGSTPELLSSGKHDASFYAQMWQQLQHEGQWHGEILDRNKDGQLLPLLQTINVIKNNDDEISHYISIITDITSIKETQTRLDFLAHHDVLTELPNRLLFTARLEHAIDRAERDNETFALLFIDLDRFKTINDSLGHQYGDQLLIEVAKRLHSLVRKSDTIARLGGDEFVVLVEQLRDGDNATTLANNVVSAMRQSFMLNGHELHVGCSIGITLYPEDGTDTVTLLKNADTAMYRVKESGRDGFHKFSPELSAAADEKLSLENALRFALRNEELALHYQPIIDLQQQRIIAVEALARWPHPQRGMISPEQFIPLAEETKLILPLGNWVAREAIHQFMDWRNQGLAPDYISINASGIQLFHPGFADTLFALLQEHELEGHQLQVELTENVLLRDIVTCRQILERLRQHGIRIAIDDFGTGYSSLAYLKQLPIDDLKIDRTFVRDIPGDEDDCAIAEAIIGLATTLGMKIVAEGVETQAQEQFLAHIGCSKVQGYHYAKPLSAADYERFQRGFNCTAMSNPMAGKKG